MPPSQQPHKAAGKLLPVSELQQVSCLPTMAHKAAGELLPVSADLKSMPVSCCWLQACSLNRPHLLR
jgi:hypothetical protein